MSYYIDTESLLQSVSLLAQATYGDDAYGSSLYSAEETTTPTDPGTPGTPGTETGVGTPGFPNTGIFNEQPLLLIPVILGGAVLIAAVILAIKRIARRVRG